MAKLPKINKPPKFKKPIESGTSVWPDLIALTLAAVSVYLIWSTRNGPSAGAKQQ